MTIDNKYSVGDTVACTVDGGAARFKVQAITIRVGGMNKPVVVYEGTLYEHGTSKSGAVLPYGKEREYIFREADL